MTRPQYNPFSSLISQREKARNQVNRCINHKHNGLKHIYFNGGKLTINAPERQIFLVAKSTWIKGLRWMKWPSEPALTDLSLQLSRLQQKHLLSKFISLHITPPSQVSSPPPFCAFSENLQAQHFLPLNHIPWFAGPPFFPLKDSF